MKRLVTFNCLIFVIITSSYAQQSLLTHPDDIYWSDKFANPGLFNRARVVTNYNSNTLVFAGHFFELPNDSSQGLDSYLLAFWNGNSWKVDGPGRVFDNLSEAINCICVVGTDIYIGGNFTTLNSASIAYLAKWDGNQWSEVGGGVNGPVHTLATDGNFNLYVGGNFNQSGDKTAYNIAKWNGFTWSVLEDQGGLTNGVNGTVSAIAIGNDGIYVGGGFSFAGGTSAKFAAKYTSTGSWEDIGVNWLYGGVLSIAVTSEDVYLGGAFTEFNGAPGNGIVKSDGSGGWLALSNGSTDVVNKVMASAGGIIYALGDFSADAGSAANRIAMWNGISWEALGDEPFQTGDVVDFTISEPNTIYTTKFAFQNPNYVYGNGIYKWDGSEWSGLGQGIGDYWTTVQYVRTLEWYNSKLVAGGYFLNAGDKYVTSLAQFDGDSWSDVGGNSTTANYNINDLIVKDGKLYAAGSFSNMGGVDANNIAVWDGNSWANLGTGVDNKVEAIHSMGNDIYVTGAFFNAGGSSAVGYARWDGSVWYPLGNGGPFAFTLTNIGNDLYAGGRFSYLNGGALYVGNIARWDGTNWNEMDGGVSGPGFSQIAVVNAFAVSGNNLIVGGDFKYAGTIPANSIAIWDGSQWSALGDGVNGIVKAILVEGNNIYVGGKFTIAGTNSAYSIARWDGANWHPLGTGFRQSNNFVSTPTVNSLLATPEGLYVGGQFTHAGNSYSNLIALYTDFTTSIENELFELPSEFVLHQNYPNPFNPTTKISWQLPVSSHQTLRIYDVLGNEVTTLVNEEKAAGSYEINFDAKELSSGIYFYKLQADSFIETKKMILIK